MISVEEALSHLVPILSPLPTEEVPLAQAGGRVLSAPVAATLTQPPFDASAMDGYALAGEGASFDLIGEAAAGHPFAKSLAQGQAVRIFTGAPVPEGADRIAIQEEAVREGDRLTLTEPAKPRAHIRPAGQDFARGDQIEAPRRLTPADVALLAAMGHATLPVTRRPHVALIPTGDELVVPGEARGPGQIVSSNTYGIAARLAAAGALPRILPIAQDRVETLAQVLSLCADADLIVTLGGASVGDHDLVRHLPGIDLSFYKIAMRPGKPLMAGRYRGTPMIGLPGNPVSAMVCTEIVLLPALDALGGLPLRPRRRVRATLTHPLDANGPREHYMRAVLVEDGAEGRKIAVHARQDSALLSVLSASDVLAIRPIGDGPRAAGDSLEILIL